MTQPMANHGSTPQMHRAGLHLEFPQSVAVFDDYLDAQKAVDHLADEKFPVENLAIVGTDLRQYERVLGSMNWGKALLNGALMGIGNGLFVALLLWFLRLAGLPTALLWGLGLGMLMGMIFSAISYAMSRGQRDFQSITQTFATRYELMAEHKVAQKAREMVHAMPEMRARAFSGQNPVAGYGDQPQV